MNAVPSFQLSALITDDIVGAKVIAGSWEEAIEHVGNMLFEAGKVKLEYITAMIKVIKEIGPYVVIAPGIALPHARPEDGVIAPCLGAVTLKNPVRFGHSQNDPVDLVFALGATDKNTHIAALQQLALFLSNPSILEEIRSAETGHALYKILTRKPESLDEVA